MDERCPKCDVRFPAERAWVEKSFTGKWTPVDWPEDIDRHVQCPGCKTVYRPNHPILGIPRDIWKMMIVALFFLFLIFELISYFM